jgi:nucleotide-binding universal stress UspA family protein
MIVLNDVVVAVDFGDATEAALTYGRNFARQFGARLHVLHVLENRFLRPMSNDPLAVESATSRQLLDRLTAGDRKDLDAAAVVRTSDEPAEEIVRYAREQNIYLIVLGTHGRRGVAHLLAGSVAERVVRTAGCPVLIVKHPEHEFVVPESPNREVGHDCVEAYPRRD